MNNLKSLMALNNLTVKELASRSGVSVSNIRRIMDDPEVTPYRRVAEILADALNTSVAQILGVKPAGAEDVELLSRRALDATEGIVRALRDYTAAPLSMSIYCEVNRNDGGNIYRVNIKDWDGNNIVNKWARLEFDESGALKLAKYTNERPGT